MPYRLLLLAFLALSICACTRKATYSASPQSGIDPNENREEKNKAGNENILIGPTTRVAFESTPYSTWFHPAYLNYKPNDKIMEELQPLLANITIKAYMGSWCLDSQRDVPRFYKVIDQARFPHSRLQLISLREDKTGLTGEEKTDSITAVPTFILYKDGKEMGRIVETAYPTIEANMVTILKSTSK